MPGVSAGIGSGRGVMNSAPGVSVRRVVQLTCLEYGGAGQDVEASVAPGVELHIHGRPPIDRVERRAGRNAAEEALQALRIGVEGLAVVVASGSPLEGAEAETAAGERRPDRAGVLPAQCLSGADDCVSCVDEPRVAALELETVDHVLKRTVVAARVPGAVDVRVEAVLVDQVPIQVPQHGRPPMADAVGGRQ